jgi:glycosyltransferase involved in cell wall biosynthesis
MLLEALGECLEETNRFFGLIRPDIDFCEHDDDLTTPASRHIRVYNVNSKAISKPISGTAASTLRKAHTNLPSMELWSVLTKTRPKGIIVNEYSPFTILAVIFGKLFHLPVLSLTEVGASNASMYSCRTVLWHWFWGQWVNGIIAACPSALQAVSGRNLPTIPLYHAVDSRKYRPLPQPKSGRSKVVFSYCGQLILRKGIDLFLAAAGKLRRHGVGDFRIQLIGEGDINWVTEAAVVFGVGDLIDFRGYQSGNDLLNILRASDVFVLPSRIDTYAVVVHEAACLGLPLLVSRNAGSSISLVEEGVTGYSFNPEDTDEFFKKLLSMMDEQSRLTFGKNARIRAEELSVHERAKELLGWLEMNFRSTTPDLRPASDSNR